MNGVLGQPVQQLLFISIERIIALLPVAHGVKKVTVLPVLTGSDGSPIGCYPGIGMVQAEVVAKLVSYGPRIRSAQPGTFAPNEGLVQNKRISTKNRVKV